MRNNSFLMRNYPSRLGKILFLMCEGSSLMRNLPSHLGNCLSRMGKMKFPMRKR